jgi:methyltransferase family protein
MSESQARSVIRELPALHRDKSGAAKVGGLNRTVGDRFVRELLEFEKPDVCETGSGLSTLVFCSLDPGSVISISPAPELHRRTLSEASERGIDTSTLRFIDDRSERALPLLALVEEHRIDAGFIDGNHGWPAVFVDFCYMNKMLRPDGVLFVDDIHVYAVGQLVGLLRDHEPHFEFTGVDGKMATFRKRADIDYLPDWTLQPFVRMNTATWSGHVPTLFET